MRKKKKGFELLCQKQDGQGVVVIARGRKKMPDVKNLLAVCHTFRPAIVSTAWGIGVKCPTKDKAMQNHFRDEVGEFYGMVIKGMPASGNGDDSHE